MIFRSYHSSNTDIFVTNAKMPSWKQKQVPNAFLGDKFLLESLLGSKTYAVEPYWLASCTNLPFLLLKTALGANTLAKVPSWEWKYSKIHKKCPLRSRNTYSSALMGAKISKNVLWNVGLSAFLETKTCYSAFLGAKTCAVCAFLNFFLWPLLFEIAEACFTILAKPSSQL